MPAAGEKLMLGIALELDAQGVVRGVSLAEGAMGGLQRRSQTQANNIESQMQRSIGGLQQAAGAAAVLGTASLAAGEAMRRGVVNPMIAEAEAFEVEMSQLQFVSQATGEELNRLREISIQTGLATQFSPAQAVEALRRLRASGLQTEEAITALQATLDLSTASAGMLDLSVAAETAGAAIQKFRPQGETAREVFDAFAQATRATNFQMEQIPVFLRSLRDMPVRFRATSAEVFALGGALRNLGLMPAQAGNAIAGLGRRLVLVESQMQRFQGRTSRLTPSQRQLVEAFRFFNVRLFDSQNRLRNMTDVFADLGDAVAGMQGDQERLTRGQRLLGDQAGQVVTALGALRHGALRGGEAFRALVAEIGNSEGVSREAAATFEDTARGMRIFLEGTIQTIRILLGEMLAPVIGSLLWLLRTISGAFLNLIRRSPALARALSWLALGMTVLLITGGSLILMFAGLALFISSLIPLITSAGAAMAALSGLAAAVAPFVLPVLGVVGALFGYVIAIVAFIFGLIEAYKRNWGGLKDFIDGWVSDVSLIWRSLIDYFTFNNLDGVLMKQLNNRGLLDSVIFIINLFRRFQQVWIGIKEVVIPVANGIIFVLSMLIKGIIMLGEGIAWLFEGMGIQFSENMSMWKTLGWILGVVVAGALILVTVLVLALILKLVILGVIALAPFIAIGLGIAAVIIGIYNLITVIEDVVDWFSNIDWGAAWDAITGFFVRIGEAVDTFFAGIFRSAYEWGTTLVTQLLSGIQSKWEDLVTWLSSSLTSITDLFPSSDAVAGPLSNLSGQGRAFVTTFQSGVEAAAPGFVTAAETVASPLAAAVTPTAVGVTPTPVEAAPASKNVTINVGGINVSVLQASAEEAERLAEMIMLRLRELEDTETEASFA
jgi:TP901 family phage tail tape measure protein